METHLVDFMTLKSVYCFRDLRQRLRLHAVSFPSRFSRAFSFCCFNFKTDKTHKTLTKTSVS